MMQFYSLLKLSLKYSPFTLHPRVPWFLTGKFYVACFNTKSN